jgi:hypothetical protein
MNRVNRLDALYFDDDEILHHKIHAIAEFDLFAVVDGRKANLTGNLETALVSSCSRHA